MTDMPSGGKALLEARSSSLAELAARLPRRTQAERAAISGVNEWHFYRPATDSLA